MTKPMTDDDYIAQRLDDQINWYDVKSGQAQRRFKWMRGIEIVAAALIPLLSTMSSETVADPRFQIAALGCLIVILAGLMGLLRYQEIWVEYRTVCETLKHEKFLYLTEAAPYDSEDRFHTLVHRVESLISKENSAWAQQTRDVGKKPAGDGSTETRDEAADPGH